MVPSWADLLLPQFFVDQYYILPIQKRHLEHLHEGVWLKKGKFWQNDRYDNLDNFPLYGFCICMDSAFIDRSTPTTAFDGTIWYFTYTM